MEATKSKLNHIIFGVEAPKCCRRLCLFPLPALRALRCDLLLFKYQWSATPFRYRNRSITKSFACLQGTIHRMFCGRPSCKEGICDQFARSKLQHFLQHGLPPVSNQICWKGLQFLLGVSPTLLQAVVGSPAARYYVCWCNG